MEVKDLPKYVDTAGRVANSVDSDDMFCMSDLNQHCLLRSVCHLAYIP